MCTKGAEKILIWGGTNRFIKDFPHGGDRPPLGGGDKGPPPHLVTLLKSLQNVFFIQIANPEI